MITKNEMEIANTSYTHKDFYQIYPELITLVNQLTDKWDPSNSNESDPGVVLLKLLAFIGDKNNYNEDKNILEAFAPSCTQEESMRKICDLMGYNMKYYKSATTTISIMCSSDKLDGTNSVILPNNTVFTNEDETISYVVNPLKYTSDIIFNEKNVQQSIDVIECSSSIGSVNDDDTYIQLSNLDSNYRLYLPETQIAENGIFIKSVDSNGVAFGEYFKSIDNLNRANLNQLVYKFGFDSTRKLPYVQFPNYIANIINGGLDIKYIRTSGLAGNISANTLTKISSDTSVQLMDANGDLTSLDIEDSSGNSIFTLNNLSASTNGCDKETIDEAYNNFKRTIGTFDTLVTCRDYANAIYQMVNNETEQIPLVSNIQVSDIRNDLNHSVRYVTFDENGVVYKTVSTKTNTTDDMSHFELCLYPFLTISGSYTKESYDNSFKPSYSNNSVIESLLEDNKTISHVITYPDTINALPFCIKLYYNVNARIITTYKVNSTEEKDILKNIYTSLYKHFNARNIDFGEEISYDKVLQVMTESDNRIKAISLDDFEIEPYVMYADGNEYKLAYTTVAGDKGASAYLDIVAKNVLANRMSLFKYDTSANTRYGQSKSSSYNLVYGVYGEANSDEHKLLNMIATFTLENSTAAQTLHDNEVIQLKAPSYKTTSTYVYGVKYNWSSSTTIKADESHLIEQGESLTLTYTSSETNKLTKVVYGYNSKTIDGVETDTNGQPQIIKPVGFDLVPNLEKSLTTTQSIEELQQVKTTFTSNLDCSWILKNNSDLLFDTNQTSRLLENGEYFFYTDSTKTSLVVLGSGTELKRSKAGSQVKLANTNINIDDISTNGLGAFANDNWTQIKLSSSSTLEISENTFITLTSGDSLSLGTSTSSKASDIANDFYDMTQDDGFKYGLGTSTPTTELQKLPGNAKWQIRSRLVINVGPTLMQTLKEQQSVTLNYVDTSTPTTITGTSDGVTIYSNLLLQNAMGTINLQTIEDSVSGPIQTNNALIYVSEIEEPTIKNGDNSVIAYDANEDITIKLLGATSESTLFESNIVKLSTDKFNLIAIYADVDSGKLTLSMTTAGDVIKFYGAGAPSTSFTLIKGLNVLQVLKDTTITIKPTSDTLTSGTLVIRPMMAVSDYNYDEFGLDNLTDSQKSQFITSVLNECAKYPQFYYNAPTYNNIAIDTTMDDPMFWFDYNNIVNRYVLAELNSNSFNDIKIAKASKL